MSKQSGLGDNCYVAGVNVSGDTNSIENISGGPAALDYTDITEFAFERKGGKLDGNIKWVSYMNDTTGTHAQLSSLPRADVLVSYLRGTLAGSAMASMVAKQLNYDAKRDADGGLLFDLEAQANAFGLDWGVQLSNSPRTDATATAPATGLDLTTVSTAFGWQAYLHVLAFTGTSVTVTLSDSADNSAFTNLAGGAFTAATAAGSWQRLAAGTPTATVRRYVRASTTGTFSNAVFAVGFTRNTTLISL